MAIDYSVVSQIAAGLVLLVAGALINRFFERRARIVVFYGHVGQFQLRAQQLAPPQSQQPPPPQSQQPPPQFVHTHAVVIRNAGRAIAQNVHVPHHVSLGATNIHVSIRQVGLVRTSTAALVAFLIGFAF